MARNIEIKARISKARTLPLVEALVAAVPVEILQTDVFFPSREGRFKLRKFPDGSGELILYNRPDEKGPKQSEYQRITVLDAETLDHMLSTALGRIGLVKKKRLLYHSGRTRIHIDDVENLGCFLELEVVLDDGEPVINGEIEAENLLSLLQVENIDLISVAYIDLLLERVREENSTV